MAASGARPAGARAALLRMAASDAFTLQGVPYFTAVRLFSLFELCLFSALVAVAVGGWSESAELVLGWSHGVGWILLCLAVAEGCRRRVFPWPLLAATVSPLGPVGSTIGIEMLSRRRRAAATG